MAAVFALCRETHFEVETAALRGDLTAEYTVCLQDMTFTLLPALVLCLLLPCSQAIWRFPWSSGAVSRPIAAVCLALLVLTELLFLSYHHKARAITLAYTVGEAGAWLLASVYDSSKSVSCNLSWVWKTLWLVMAFAAVLKVGTYGVISVMDSEWSPGVIALYGVKASLALVLTLPWLPISLPVPRDSSSTSSEPITHTEAAVKWTVTAVLLNSQVVYGLGVLTLPAYAMTLHASAVSIGVMFGAYSLAILVFSPVFGRLSFAWGRIRTVVTGCVCLALSTLLFAAANSLPALILARALQGVAASASFTPALALLTDSTAASALGETLGEVTGWAGLGMLLGPPIGALLAAWKGYSVPFYFGAFTSLSVALLACALLREGPRHLTSVQPMSYRKLMPILGAIALGAATLTMLEPIIPLLLRSKFQASQAQMGLIFALVVATFGLMSPLAGKIADKAGRIPVLISGLLFLGSTLPVLALPQSIYLVTGCLALVGAALALVLVPTLPELAEQARQQGLTAYEGIYALFNSSYAVGSIVGPVAGGVVVQGVGFQTGLLCFGVALVAYSTGLGSGRSQEKDKETASLL